MKLRIKYTMTAPISHIGEVASTGSYFQMLTTSIGKLPIITANSVRGILRDCSAKHLLRNTGLTVDKEIFNVLFSGGNLSGASKLDVERAKAVRMYIPSISLFGAGLGTMIMAGKMDIGNLYPLCTETEEMLGEQSDGISWRQLLDEIEYTRTDDIKDDYLAKQFCTDSSADVEAKASTQMRYSVQYMGAGTVFIQDIYLFDECTPLEIGAFYAAVAEWFKLPRLGGMANKGFGFFHAETDGIKVDSTGTTITEDTKSLIDAYTSFIKMDTVDHIGLLRAKNGKK